MSEASAALVSAAPALSSTSAQRGPPVAGSHAPLSAGPLPLTAIGALPSHHATSAVTPQHRSSVARTGISAGVFDGTCDPLYTPQLPPSHNRGAATASVDYYGDADCSRDGGPAGASPITPDTAVAAPFGRSRALPPSIAVRIDAAAVVTTAVKFSDGRSVSPPASAASGSAPAPPASFPTAAVVVREGAPAVETSAAAAPVSSVASFAFPPVIKVSTLTVTAVAADVTAARAHSSTATHQQQHDGLSDLRPWDEAPAGLLWLLPLSAVELRMRRGHVIQSETSAASSTRSPPPLLDTSLGVSFASLIDLQLFQTQRSAASTAIAARDGCSEARREGAVAATGASADSQPSARRRNGAAAPPPSDLVGNTSSFAVCAAPLSPGVIEIDDDEEGGPVDVVGSGVGGAALSSDEVAALLPSQPHMQPRPPPQPLLGASPSSLDSQATQPPVHGASDAAASAQRGGSRGVIDRRAAVTRASSSAATSASASCLTSSRAAALPPLHPKPTTAATEHGVTVAAGAPGYGNGGGGVLLSREPDHSVAATPVADARAGIDLGGSESDSGSVAAEAALMRLGSLGEGSAQGGDRGGGGVDDESASADSGGAGNHTARAVRVASAAVAAAAALTAAVGGVHAAAETTVGRSASLLAPRVSAAGVAARPSAMLSGSARPLPSRSAAEQRMHALRLVVPSSSSVAARQGSAVESVPERVHLVVQPEVGPPSPPPPLPSPPSNISAPPHTLLSLSARSSPIPLASAVSGSAADQPAIAATPIVAPFPVSPPTPLAVSSAAPDSIELLVSPCDPIPPTAATCGVAAGTAAAAACGAWSDEEVGEGVGPGATSALRCSAGEGGAEGGHSPAPRLPSHRAEGDGRSTTSAAVSGAAPHFTTTALSRDCHAAAVDAATAVASATGVGRDDAEQASQSSAIALSIPQYESDLFSSSGGSSSGGESGDEEMRGGVASVAAVAGAVEQPASAIPSPPARLLQPRRPFPRRVIDDDDDEVDDGCEKEGVDENAAALRGPPPRPLLPPIALPYPVGVTAMSSAPSDCPSPPYQYHQPPPARGLPQLGAGASRSLGDGVAATVVSHSALVPLSSTAAARRHPLANAPSPSPVPPAASSSDDLGDDHEATAPPPVSVAAAALAFSRATVTTSSLPTASTDAAGGKKRRRGSKLAPSIWATAATNNVGAAAATAAFSSVHQAAASSTTGGSFGGGGGGGGGALDWLGEDALPAVGGGRRSSGPPPAAAEPGNGRFFTGPTTTSTPAPLAAVPATSTPVVAHPPPLRASRQSVTRRSDSVAAAAALTSMHLLPRGLPPKVPPGGEGGGVWGEEEADNYRASGVLPSVSAGSFILSGDAAASSYHTNAAAPSTLSDGGGGGGILLQLHATAAGTSTGRAEAGAAGASTSTKQRSQRLQLQPLLSAGSINAQSISGGVYASGAGSGAGGAGGGGASAALQRHAHANSTSGASHDTRGGGRRARAAASALVATRPPQAAALHASGPSGDDARRRSLASPESPLRPRKPPAAVQSETTGVVRSGGTRGGIAVGRGGGVAAGSKRARQQVEAAAGVAESPGNIRAGLGKTAR